jgi:hypothetical protein
MTTRAWFSKLAAIVAAYKKRIATIALGQTFNVCFDLAFNYPLYLYVIEKNGIIKGYAWLTIADFILCWMFLKFYDWLKRDWLGIEALKELGEYGPQWIKKLSVESRVWRILWWPFSKFSLFLLWIVRKGRIPAFIAFSIFTDPFVTTVYMRKGWGEYGGMNKKDWGLFILSGLIGNAWWAIRSLGILEAAKAIWERI